MAGWMRRRIDVGLVASLVALVACGGGEARKPAAAATTATGPASATASAAPAAPTAAGPEPVNLDFDTASKREVAALPRKRVAAGAFSAEIEAAAEPKVFFQDNLTHLTIPFGSRTPMQCVILEAPKDAAALMARMRADLATKVELTSFAVADVFVVGEHAVLTAHATYLAATPAGKAAGQLKVAYHNDALAPALCTHDEVGYGASFARIAKGLFETARLRDRRLGDKIASYWEVHALKVDGKPLGYHEHRRIDDASTKLTTTTDVTATLLPRSPSNPLPRDRVTVHTVDSSGVVLELVEASFADGETDLNVTLKRVAAGSYAYRGEQRGKPLGGTFATVDKAGLTSDIGLAARIKNELLTGKASSFVAEEYDPLVNPTAPRTATYTLESLAERRIGIAKGGTRAVATADASGRIAGVTVSDRGATFTVERVAAGGRP
ncbi:MAG: hypothetical protein JST00_15435 [Deltaproteobacteria bacterium]|nr:hypothetical protein [Deltaproteobacteria bacterium]